MMTGEWRRALALGLLALTMGAGARQSLAPEQQFEEAVTLLEIRRDYPAAAAIFEKLAKSADRPTAAGALVYLGTCYERMAEDKAREVYRRVVEQYADQPAAVAQARARLAALERRTAPSVPRRNVRPLWEERRASGLPGRPSRDGRYLPIITPAGLVLQDLATGQLGAAIPLVAATTTMPECQPSPPVLLSPNAGEAAFACAANGDEYELRVIRVNGPSRAVRRLAGAGPREYIEPLEWTTPAWLLAQIVAADRRARLVRVPLADASPVTLAELPAPAGMASLSPDRAWVVFDATAEGSATKQKDIFIVPATGGTPRPLVAEPFHDRFPVWTPDGRGILFVSDRTGSDSLWLQEVARDRPSGAARQLFPDLGRVVVFLGLSGAGRYVYWRETGLVDVHVVDLDARGLPAGPVRNSSTRRIGQNLMPAWSPDGAQFAYVSRDRGIVIREIASGAERLVGEDLANVVHPRWSPDGTLLLVRAYDAGQRYGLFTVDARSDRVTALKVVGATEESELTIGRWERDGRTVICFFSNRILRIDARTGAEEIVDTFPREVAAATPDVSFVDNSIVYAETERATGRNTLKVRSSDGTARVLIAAAAGESFRNPVWLPGNRGVLFVRYGADPKRRGATTPSLQRLDLSDNSVHALDIALEDPRDPAVSPDGRRLAFTAGRPTREPWVLENFLPRESRVESRQSESKSAVKVRVEVGSQSRQSKSAVEVESQES